MSDGKPDFIWEDNNILGVIDDTYEEMSRVETQEHAVYGRHTFLITEADIEALRAGKVLFYCEEYSYFIKLAIDE